MNERRACAACALVLASAAVATLLLTLAGRVFFPWPLEWMEGGSVAHAERLLQGAPLYAAPNSEFIPYLYPPLAYLPMALALQLFGPSLPAARLASLACTLLALLAVGRAGARAAHHRLGAAIAAALFAVGFGYGGAFLDLARVDACFIALVAMAAERLLARRTRTALALLTLSVFAKQHGLILLAATALALLARDRRRHAPAVAASFCAVLTVFLALELATNGWFGRYTVALPLGHGLVWPLLFSFLFVDVIVYLPVLALASGLALARRARRLCAHDALLLSGLLVSALGRAHAGGDDNVRLPALTLLSIAAAPWLTRAILSQRRAHAALGCGLFALQLALLWQAPSVHRPTPASATAFAVLRATLARCAHGGSSVALDYAGLTQSPFLHTMALSDLLLGRDATLAALGKAALLTRLLGPAAPRALAVGARFPELERALAERYRVCAELAAPTLATGYQPGLGRAGGRRLVVYALRE